MKNIFLTISFLVLSYHGISHAVPAHISHVRCQGTNEDGAAKVVFTGYGFFNITEFNQFGLPVLTQQARILSADYSNGILKFKLHGMIKDLDYILTLKNGTGSGKISTTYGTMKLTCTASINADNE